MSILVLLALSASADDRLFEEEAPGDRDERLFEEDDQDRLRGWTRDVTGKPKPIINGEEAYIDDFPSAGALIAEPSSGSIRFDMFSCSSTLIAPDVVLTAAHCLEFNELMKLQLGVEFEEVTFYFTQEEDVSDIQAFSGVPRPEDSLRAASFEFHEDWVGLSGIAVGIAENNDIGVLFLEEPVYDIPLAILPTPEEAEQIQEGDPVWVVGWGQRVQDQPGGQGPAGEKQMGESWISELGDPEMKVGDIPTDVRKCHGDSGGPTFWQLVETDTLDPIRQIGITSHAYDAYTDCTQTGSTDTRVDYHLEWLDDLLRERCEDGTRSWCPQNDKGEDLVEDWGILAPPLPEAERGLACGCQSTPTPLGAVVWALPALVLLGRRRNNA